MRQFYTKTGDDGYTGLIGDERVPKYHPQPEALGSLDEASAVLGMVRASTKLDEINQIIMEVQRDLYRMMSEVSATPENASRFREIDAEKVNWLEVLIDDITTKVEIPDGFILPGDTFTSSLLALSRTIIRRAERHIASLIHQDLLENLEILRYINRLSSLCFVLELYENQNPDKTSPTMAEH
jgi:cob(I)alamin adenosyltransferase